MARSSSVRALLPDPLRRRLRHINIGTGRFNLVAVLLLASLLFGGSSLPGLWIHTVLQLIGVLVLVPLLTLFIRDYRSNAAGNVTLLLLAGVVAVPLVQQIPLPPDIWRALPGRETFVAPAVMAGDLWRPITLSPSATWGSFFSLFPLIGIFVGTWLMSWSERRSLCTILLGFGAFSAFLGILQLGAGPESVLRFYEFTTAEDPVGFFGSRNNFGALLYALLPFAVIWLVRVIQQPVMKQDAAARMKAMTALGGCVILFLLTLFLARSRAGFGLGLLGLVGGLAVAMFASRAASLPRTRVVIWSLVGFALLIASFYGLDRILPRFDVEGVLQYRSTIATVTQEAIWHFFPAGTGMGTFQSVYQLFERPETIIPPVVNRAHNEYLELLLETGILGAILLLAFLGWFVVMSVRAFADDDRTTPTLDRMLQRAAVLTVVLLLIHSSVDFILRTSAIAGILAFALALLLTPIDRARPQSAPRSPL